MKESIALGAIAGSFVTVAIEAGTRIDKALNPQVYQLFADSTRWYQYLTSKHAFTAAYLENEPISALLTLAIVSTTATIAIVGRKKYTH